jgi:outer membrane protein assembly factor BamB
MRGISSSTLKFPLKQVWKVAAGRPIIATAVSDGSHAFLGDGSGKFQALALADGKAAWEFKIKDPIEGSAAILGESVIFGAGDGLVYCLNKKDGTLHWKATTEGEIKGAVNIYRPKDKPPVVLVGSYDNQLYAFDSADGKKLWTVPTSNYINGAAALAGETALFGGCDGFIYLVDVNTGKEHRLDHGHQWHGRLRLSLWMRPAFGESENQGHKLELPAAGFSLRV